MLSDRCRLKEARGPAGHLFGWDFLDVLAIIG